MSFDTKLTRYCDHKVIEEDHTVDFDLKTVYLKQYCANIDQMKVRVNNVALDRNEKNEALTIDDVTNQVTGSNSIFTVQKVPIYDGCNKRRIASRLTDVTILVSVFDEDASAQFTGADVLLVTQHRPLLSIYNINAAQLTANDIVVKVNAIEVEIDSIEPMFGKIVLKVAPLITDIVTVSYHYKAKVDVIDGDSGIITVRETPELGQNVYAYYFSLEKNGWSLESDSTLNTSKIIFDKEKYTNIKLVQNEDVSSQLNGLQSTFYTKYKPIIPPRANLMTQPIETLPTQIVVKINGIVDMPVFIDAEKGFINIGSTPRDTDIVTITYHYRSPEAADIVSVDYPVAVNQCRKCRRTGQVNDFDYDKLGQLVTVVREQKMLQDLKKMVIAIKGTNTAHPWYGTSLITYIGTARLPEYYKVKFKGEIINTGEQMKDLQMQQARYQQVDDEEFFSFLSNITVEQSDVDPDFYEVDTTVVSQAATAIQLSTSLYFNKPLIAGSLL